MTVFGLTPSDWQAFCRVLARVLSSLIQLRLQVASLSKGANIVLSQFIIWVPYAWVHESENRAIGCRSNKVIAAVALEAIQAASRNKSCMAKIYSKRHRK